jgi:hypothetical protein
MPLIASGLSKWSRVSRGFIMLRIDVALVGALRPAKAAEKR